MSNTIGELYKTDGEKHNFVRETSILVGNYAKPMGKNAIRFTQYQKMSFFLNTMRYIH